MNIISEERFGKCAILKLKTNGFEKLSQKQKHLVYHLSEAGLQGRNIHLLQNYEHNLVVRNVLEETLKELYIQKTINEEVSQLENYLKLFWLNNGIYEGLSNKKIDIELEKNELLALIKQTKKESGLSQEDIDLTMNILFNNSFTEEFSSIQADGVDVIARSGNNYYKNLNQMEYDIHLDNGYDVKKGFNSRLVKNNITKEITEEFIFENGLYSKYVRRIIKSLENALSYSENKEQAKSISSLIKFYKKGTLKSFDEHSIKWLNDNESHIFFINGLIESYDDPKGNKCTFESIVGFKNPEETVKVNKIIDNIQWFENNMPVDERFKKSKATGLSASSLTVISMAGATSPKLPLGICLPNDDWIRSTHGSKSVNLSNVASSRGASNLKIKDEFFLPEYQEGLKLYGSETNSLHTDLHEIAGHGSCKNLKGVSNDALDIYYSIIEEARADLVGLYFIGNKKLVDFGVMSKDIDLNIYTETAYVNYITNGLMLQLKRVDEGDDLSQAHLRNRQSIVKWILKNVEDNCVEILKIDNKHYVKINNIENLRLLFGKLLGSIQKIKSTGDLKNAQYFVETYGTKVDNEMHKEVIERMSSLDLPTVTGFKTPLYRPITNFNNETIDYEIYEKGSFIEEQLYLSIQYS